MRLNWRMGLLAWACALAVACGDTIVNVPTTPSQTTPPVTTPPVVKNVVQFRVNGNATSVRIRYSTPIDGLGQVVTSLPYFNTQTISDTSMFLSLEATPSSYGFQVVYPFLSVQIAVNGTVFREATTQDFMLVPLLVSGQWRQ